MTYKELKDEKDEKDVKHEPPNCIAYAEILMTLIITGMICGTMLTLQSMWVQEKHYEMSFLRGTTP